MLLLLLPPCMLIIRILPLLLSSSECTTGCRLLLLLGLPVFPLLLPQEKPGAPLATDNHHVVLRELS